MLTIIGACFLMMMVLAWYYGFAENIDFSNILHVELLRVYHGLKMA